MPPGVSLTSRFENLSLHDNTLDIASGHLSVTHLGEHVHL